MSKPLAYKSLSLKNRFWLCFNVVRRQAFEIVQIHLKGTQRQTRAEARRGHQFMLSVPGLYWGKLGSESKPDRTEGVIEFPKANTKKGRILIHPYSLPRSLCRITLELYTLVLLVEVLLPPPAQCNKPDINVLCSLSLCLFFQHYVQVYITQTAPKGLPPSPLFTLTWVFFLKV